MDLLNLLARLNRKERYFLFQAVIGEDNFHLSHALRETLREVTGLAVPQDAYFATDYHLDWLYAALVLSQQQSTKGTHLIDAVHVNDNQEDIDLLIAYPDGASYQLLLIEAKGFGAWNIKQLMSKAKRLQAILGEKLENCPSNVNIQFVLTSRFRPQRIQHADFPSWMLGKDGSFQWFKLETPDNRLQITRCDKGGVAKKQADYWKCIEVNHASDSADQDVTNRDV